MGELLRACLCHRPGSLPFFSFCSLAILKMCLVSKADGFVVCWSGHCWFKSSGFKLILFNYSGKKYNFVTGLVQIIAVRNGTQCSVRAAFKIICGCCGKGGRLVV